MATYELPKQTEGTLGGLIQLVAHHLNWGPSLSEETERMVLTAIRNALTTNAQAHPWMYREQEFEIPLEADVVCDEGDEDDRVWRHDDDPFVLMREGVAVLDGDVWPTDGKWRTRYIRIENEDGDDETRRICDVWKVSVPGSPPTVTFYMAVDRALTITGDDLQYRVYTRHYHLPQGTIDLVQNQVSVKGQTGNAEVRPTTDMRYDMFDPENRATNVSRVNYRWFASAPESIPTPPREPLVELDTAEEPVLWEGPDLPGTFQYAVSWGWGVWPNLTNTTDAHWKDRPFPRIIGDISRPSAEIETDFEEAAIKIQLVDPEWFFGRGDHNLATPPADEERHGHTGLRAYVWKRQLTVGATPDLLDDTNFAVHAPADGGWYLWRVVEEGDLEVYETMNTIYDTGAIRVDRRRSPNAGPVKTITPEFGPQTSGWLRFRARLTPDLLTSDSADMRLTPVGYNAIAYHAASEIAQALGQLETSAVLYRGYTGLVNSMKPATPGASSNVRRRVGLRRRA